MYISCGYNVGIWDKFLLYRTTDIIFKTAMGDFQWPKLHSKYDNWLIHFKKLLEWSDKQINLLFPSETNIKIYYGYLLWRIAIPKWWFSRAARRQRGRWTWIRKWGRWRRHGCNWGSGYRGRARRWRRETNLTTSSYLLWSNGWRCCWRAGSRVQHQCCSNSRHYTICCWLNRTRWLVSWSCKYYIISFSIKTENKYLYTFTVNVTLYLSKYSANMNMIQTPFLRTRHKKLIYWSCIHAMCPFDLSIFNTKSRGWSRSSSSSIVSDYGLDDWGLLPERGRGFFF
jgi:hypothetical protein